MREWLSPEYQIKQIEEQLVYIRNDIKNAEANENTEWLNNSKEIEKSLLKEIENNKEIIKNGISEDAWKKDLDERIENLEATIKDYEETGITEWNKRWYSESKQALEDYKYLKANNIKPLDGWEYNSLTFLKNLSSFLGLGLLIAGIAVFMSDIVSGECTPATLKFLLAQPMKRWKILLSKYIVSVLTVLLMIILPQLIGMTIVNSTSNMDVSNYPIRIEQKYEETFDQTSQEIILEQIPNTSKMVSNTEYTLKSIGYQAMFIVTACSVVFMFSTIFKSSMISMAVSVILSVFLTIGTQVIGTIKDYSHVLFTTYADAFSVINANLPLMYGNAKLTEINGLICMIITSILAYTIAYINFTKKDILI